MKVNKLWVMNESIHFVKFVILSLARNGIISDVYFVYFFLPLLILTQPEHPGEGTAVSSPLPAHSSGTRHSAPLFPFLKVNEGEGLA